MIEINGNSYHVTYVPETHTIAVRGVLRLYGTDGYIDGHELARNRGEAAETDVPTGGYASIMKLLLNILSEKPAEIILDLRELQFVNSSGINIFSKFAVKLGEQERSHLTIRGNQKLSWQSNVFTNLKTILPTLTLSFE